MQTYVKNADFPHFAPSKLNTRQLLDSNRNYSYFFHHFPAEDKRWATAESSRMPSMRELPQKRIAAVALCIKVGAGTYCAYASLRNCYVADYEPTVKVLSAEIHVREG